MNVLEEARLSGKHIFICGNGGSAATASHDAGDFNKGVNMGLLKLDGHSSDGTPNAEKMKGDLEIKKHSLYGLLISLSHKLHAIISFKCTSNRNFIQFKHIINFIRNIPRHFIEFEQFE